MSEKTEQKSMVQIALRDEMLMKEMIPGVCPFLHLYKNFQAYFPSEHAIRERLGQLVRSGYINSELYLDSSNGKKFALYSLGPAGCEYVTQKCYTSADEIRTTIPSPHTVSHELAVTGVIRTLRRESIYFPYHLRYYDDPTCRSHRKLLGLKAPVPDVLGDILLDNSNIAYRVNIEVHMGTMPLIRVIDKAIKQEWQTIYLCNTNNNMNTLRNAMQDYPKLKGMVYFAIISDFCMKPGGLFGSNYMSLEREVSLYP